MILDKESRINQLYLLTVFSKLFEIRRPITSFETETLLTEYQGKI